MQKKVFYKKSKQPDPLPIYRAARGQSPFPTTCFLPRRRSSCRWLGRWPEHPSRRRPGTHPRRRPGYPPARASAAPPRWLHRAVDWEQLCAAGQGWLYVPTARASAAPLPWVLRTADRGHLRVVALDRYVPLLTRASSSPPP
jgi:hypothetical protein